MNTIQYNPVASNEFDQIGPMNTNDDYSSFIKINKPKAIDIFDFVTMDIPERQMLLAPILCERGLVMIYAPRGIGKSWLCLTLAWSIATGNTIIPQWPSTRPSRVLYVDGEMSADDLQKRMKIISGNNITREMANNFHIYTPDMQESPIINLAKIDGQDQMEYIIGDRDVIFIDNISTLCSFSNENDVESWTPVKDWLLRMRKKGKSVVLVHHSGKNGSQRGTSSREDILDTVIALQYRKGNRVEDGAQFKVKFEKARGFKGVDASPFSLKMNLADNKITWESNPLSEKDMEKEDEQLELILALHDEGKTLREISAETGLSKSTVERRIKTAHSTYQN